ncbi:MAG: TolC family protein [Acidobacteriaceae bacterium]
MQIRIHKRPTLRLALIGLAAACLSAAAAAQTADSSSSQTSALYGSVATAPRNNAVLPLSLDEAIHRGLQHNLQIVLATQDQRAAAGIRLQAVNTLMPTITWGAQRSRNQIDLAAEGFRRSLLSKFPPGFLPASAFANFQPVVTVNVVSAQANLDQTLFDLRSFELYRAARQEIRAVDYSLGSSQQDVVQTVADSYLQVLADGSNVANARGLLATNAEILRQANLKYQAGVVARLDELRAQVQYQQQEQALVARQNDLEKAKIVLKREIGLATDQKINLTDDTPFAELATIPLDQALRQAYAQRQDYLRLQAKLRSAQYQSRAARFERLPTLKFNGNYGVVGTVGGIYHGAFLAQGTISVPIFREAKLRGDRDVADAATRETMAQLAGLKNQIDAQLRDDLLDVATAERLVKVAQNTVDLSQAALNDTTDRYKNGVADDLPVVQAQASLATAQAQLVNSLYQYNRAKLGLARNLGIIDRQYRAYLGDSAQGSSMRASQTGKLGSVAISGGTMDGPAAR